MMRMMTERPALQFHQLRVLLVPEIYSQNTQSQKSSNDDLGLAIHLQVPDYKDRQNTEDQIREGGKDREDNGEISNDLGGVACLALVLERESCPEVADWMALEDEEKEVHSRSEYHEYHGEVDRPYV